MNGKRGVLFITVGTSALDAANLAPDDLLPAQRGELADRLKTYRGKEQTRDDQRAYERENEIFVTIRDLHRQHWRRRDQADWDRKGTSAELSSTSLLLAETDLLAPLDAQQDQFVLVLSDTKICNLSGRINAQLMHDMFFACQCGASFQDEEDLPNCHRIVLHTVPQMDALQGFQPMIGEFDKLIDKYLPKGSLAFNITGGYKGAIPSITSICIARRKSWPLYYLHESQSAVIRVDFPASRGGLASETAHFVPPQHTAS